MAVSINENVLERFTKDQSRTVVTKGLFTHSDFKAMDTET